MSLKTSMVMELPVDRFDKMEPILSQNGIGFTKDYIGSNVVLYLDSSTDNKAVRFAHSLNMTMDVVSEWVTLPLNFANVELAITAMRKAKLELTSIRRNWWSRRQKVLTTGPRVIVEAFAEGAKDMNMEEFTKFKEFMDNSQTDDSD